MITRGYSHTPPVEKATDLIPGWNFFWIAIILGIIVFFLIYCKGYCKKKTNTNTQAEPRTYIQRRRPPEMQTQASELEGTLEQINAETLTLSSARISNVSEEENTLAAEERALTDVFNDRLFEDDYSNCTNDLRDVVIGSASSADEGVIINTTATVNQVTPPPMYHEVIGTMPFEAPPSYSEFIAKPDNYTKVS